VTRKTVLVIDDQGCIRRVLERVLSRSGFAVAEACNGQEAIEYLYNHDLPCVIVLDLQMPVMDGVQFRHWQLSDPNLARVPVIVHSGGLGTDARRGLGDVAAYCPKPSSPLELVRLVTQLCA
jgi:CheY-like chemotaxis protein